MTYGAAEYEACANALVDRILALIPAHPEILEMTDPFELCKLNDFIYADLQPSLFQAQWALKRAQRLHHDRPV